MTTTASRLAQVRQEMRNRRVDAVMVLTSDPHLSEYLPERWQGRRWLSGFTGSMAHQIVTQDRAALFADSRYWAQAERELAGTGIELVKINSPAAKPYVDWLVTQLEAGQVLATDGHVLGLALAEALRTGLRPAGIHIDASIDVFETVWGDRPGLPDDPVYEHMKPHASVSRAEKLAHVRAAMAAQGASHHFISSVDDIAWLLNLRGSDVAYNPVFIAHVLVDANGATLFVKAGKLSPELGARLQQDGVATLDYAAAATSLAALPDASVLLVDPRRVTLGLRNAVPRAVRLVESINPSTLAKSRKTPAEAGYVRSAMEQDGAAMCEFYAGFEAALARGESLSEISVDEQLTAARARRAGFMGLSFPTVAGFSGNGAIPHYRATTESHAWIKGDGLLLIDSGAQYLGGTTDITRVWPIGRVSTAQKRDYTLVLKGMLALSAARFPRGTPGPMLDAIARTPMWAHGLDYGHGTGHGVGYFLNVHEGPQGISKTGPDASMAMEPGMITSIEPGVYRAGQWGVRIENLVLTVPVDTPECGQFGEILGFETLTLCPIDTRCIDFSLLRQDEVEALNRYHAEVRHRLSPMLAAEALSWLQTRTQAV